MAKTKRYKQLPPDSGVSFEPLIHLSGFGDIKLESRRQVENEIRDFMKYCEREAIMPAARVILGIWGEGKTEAFNRYIKNRAESSRNFAYHVTASSVANAYTRYKSMDTSEAKLLLTAFFQALKDEQYIDLIPSPSAYFDLDQWLEKVLDQHFRGDKRKRIFLFIDEIEQYIHQPEILRSIIRGVKLLLDGKYLPISERGKYPGCISIFLACTPEAYNRISTDPDIRQVFGGYGRRMRTISLNPISRQEAVEFLYDLLKYSYEGSIPVPPPFSSSGVFYGLATISRRNMGNMVSLYTRLMSTTAGESEGDIDVIDSNRFLEFAASSRVSIEGVETQCMETELLEEIEKRFLADEHGGIYIKILRLLLGEMRPFSLAEIAERCIPPTVSPLAERCVSFLERELRNLGYSVPILRFSRANATSEEEILQSLENHIERSELQFSQSILPRDDLRDSLFHYELGIDGNLVPHIYVPTDKKTLSAILPNLSEEHLGEIFDVLHGFSDSEKTFYRISNDVTFQIYPPPCPPGLDFIRDPLKRFELWRKSTSEFTMRYVADMPTAFAKLIASSENLTMRVASENLRPLKRGSFAVFHYTKEGGQNTSIRVYIAASPGGFTEQDIKGINVDLASEEFTQMVVLIHSGDTERSISEDFREPILEKLLDLKIHTSFAKQMLAALWCMESGEPIHEDLFKLAMTNLFERDLSLPRLMRDWLRNGTDKGLIIGNLRVDELSSINRIQEAMRMVLNCPSGSKTALELHSYNWEYLRKLIPYGTKRGLVPDLGESMETFRGMISDLERNGFIRRDSQDRVVICSHPVEDRIMSLLSGGHIEKSRLPLHFVMLSDNTQILETVYVPILEQKGLVTRNPRVRIKNSVEEFIEDGKGQYQAFQESINSNPFLQDRSCFAHVFVAKQRDAQLITLEVHKNLIQRVYEEMMHSSLSSEKLRAAVVLKSLVGDFQDLFVKKISLASRQVDEIKNGVEEPFNRMYQRLSSVLNLCSTWLNIDYRPKEIANYIELEEAKNNIIQFACSDFSIEMVEGLRRVCEEEDPEFFSYRNIDSDDNSMNIVVWTLLGKKGDYEEILDKADRFILELEQESSSIKDQLESIRSEILTRQIPENLLISLKALDVLNRRCRIAKRSDVDMSGHLSMRSISLKGILENIREQKPSIDSRIRELRKCCRLLDDVNQAEKHFLESLDSQRIFMERIESHFDLPGSQEAVESLNGVIQDNDSCYKEEVQALSDEKLVTSAWLEESEEKFRNATKDDLEEIKELLVENLWIPFARGIRTQGREMDRLIGMSSDRVDLFEVEQDWRQVSLPSNVDEFLSGELKASEYVQKVGILRDAMLTKLKDILDENEIKVLNKCISISSDSEESWIERDAVVNALNDEFDLNGKSIDGILIRLEKRGFLSRGLRICF